MTRDVIMQEIHSAQTELADAIKLASEVLTAVKAPCQTPDELAIIAKIDAAAPKYKEIKLGHILPNV